MMIRPRLKAAVLLFSLSLFLWVPGMPMGAQSFRGEIAARVSVPLQDDAHSPSLGGGQVLIIQRAADPHWLEGLDISVSLEGDDPVPPGAYALVIFSDVDTTGEPDDGFITMGGRQWASHPILSAAPVTTTIPIRNRTTGHQPREGIEIASGEIALQIVPVMKGMPPSIANRQFTVSLTPRFSIRGGLAITLTGDPAVVAHAQELLEVRLDRVAVDADGLIVLDPGIYRVAVQAGNLLEQSRNVAIESASITTLAFEPLEPVARVRFSLPSVAEVFLDGVRIDSRVPLVREPGRHLMLIRLGDFTISRQMILEAHQEYEIGLDMDVLIRRH